jgi:hypothetical protein
MNEERYEAIVDILGVCGCLDHEALELIVAELKAARYVEGSDSYSTDINRQALRSLMDRLGWITHGIAIRASISTDEGEALLKQIEALP